MSFDRCNECNKQAKLPYMEFDQYHDNPNCTNDKCPSKLRRERMKELLKDFHVMNKRSE